MNMKGREDGDVRRTCCSPSKLKKISIFWPYCWALIFYFFGLVFRRWDPGVHSSVHYLIEHGWNESSFYDGGFMWMGAFAQYSAWCPGVWLWNQELNYGIDWSYSEKGGIVCWWRAWALEPEFLNLHLDSTTNSVACSVGQVTLPFCVLVFTSVKWT